jgi:predicted nucleic acid-binding protein
LKLALDTNVVLDVLLERAPFAEPARRLWSAVETRKAEGVVAAHTLTTVWYLVAQSKGRASARGVVGLLARVFGVAKVDTQVVGRALALEFDDFEDAVCAAAAEAASCDLIVTRDRKDFGNSPVTAVDPLTAVAMVEDGGASGVSERRTTYGARRTKSKERPFEALADLIGCVRGGDPRTSSRGRRWIARQLQARRARTSR